MADYTSINQTFSQIQSKDLGWANRVTNQHINQLSAEYRAAYNSVDAEIAALYKKIDTMTYAEMQKYNRLTALRKEIALNLKSLRDSGYKVVGNDLVQEYKVMYDRTLYSGSVAVTGDISYVMIDRKTIEAAMMKRYDFTTVKPVYYKSIDAVNANVNSAIQQGLLQGHGYAKMTRGIKEQFNRGFKDAVRITRTEGNRARSIGQLDGFDYLDTEFGIKTMKIWIATFDGRTRPEHGDADGMEVENDQPFELNDGVVMDAPGLSGVGYHDINCRCTMGTKVVNIKPSKRRYDAGIGSNITFSEWKGKK